MFKGNDVHFLVGQVSGLVENIGIFSDIIIVMNVKLCKIVPCIKLYLFITLSVTLTTFEGQSSAVSNSFK